MDKPDEDRRARQEKERIARLERAIASIERTRKIVDERLARSEARRAG